MYFNILLIIIIIIFDLKIYLFLVKIKKYYSKISNFIYDVHLKQKKFFKFNKRYL